jgi:hypothetical protein
MRQVFAVCQNVHELRRLFKKIKDGGQVTVGNNTATLRSGNWHDHPGNQEGPFRALWGAIKGNVQARFNLSPNGAVAVLVNNRMDVKEIVFYHQNIPQINDDGGSHNTIQASSGQGVLNLVAYHRSGALARGGRKALHRGGAAAVTTLGALGDAYGGAEEAVATVVLAPGEGVYWGLGKIKKAIKKLKGDGPPTAVNY